jgi:release factor glutamine methyltransferase
MNAGVDEIAATLRQAGSVFAEDEADLLTGAASSPGELEDMVRRRVAGEPLEAIVGWAEFCGLRIVVKPGVFVPRTRTGILVDEGARLIDAGSVVVDLCCGTGAVGVALHAHEPGIELYASDVEPAAVACARRNVEPIGGRVLAGDLFDALPEELRGRVDLLVVNAPYVPTDAIALMPPEARDHEPHVALDGGADGVGMHRRVAAGARDWLAPGGHLVIETSSRQADLTAAAFSAVGLEPRVVTSDQTDGTAVIGSLPSADRD